MNKIPRIAKAMNEISDEHLEKADEKPKKRSKMPVILAVSGACAAAVGGAFLIKTALSPTDIGGYVSTSSYQTSDIISSVSSTSGGEPDVSSASEPEHLPESPAVANPNEPYKGGEFSIDRDDLPFDYDGSSPSAVSVGINNGGMGFEGIMAYDVSEIVDNNPWNENMKIDELPVFRYNAGIVTPTYFMPEAVPGGKEYDRIMSVIAEKYPEVTASQKFPETVQIEFPDNVSVLPEGYELDQYDGTYNGEKLAKAYKYLAEKYADILGFDKYALSVSHHYTFDGETSWSGYIYNATENPFKAIMSYNFGRVSFLEVGKGYDFDGNRTGFNFVIRVRNLLDKLDCEGFYPVITASEAREKLLSGDFNTTVPEEYLKNGITEDVIEHIELVYKDTNQGYSLPYYRFLIKLDDDALTLPDGLHIYGGYYVPAISPEYIADIDTDTRFN